MGAMNPKSLAEAWAALKTYTIDEDAPACMVSEAEKFFHAGSEAVFIIMASQLQERGQSADVTLENIEAEINAWVATNILEDAKPEGPLN